MAEPAPVELGARLDLYPDDVAAIGKRATEIAETAQVLA